MYSNYLTVHYSGEDLMQVGVGIDYDQLTDTVYWSDIRYSVSIYHVQVYVTTYRSTTGAQIVILPGPLPGPR